MSGGFPPTTAPPATEGRAPVTPIKGAAAPLRPPLNLKKRWSEVQGPK